MTTVDNVTQAQIDMMHQFSNQNTANTIATAIANRDIANRENAATGLARAMQRNDEARAAQQEAADRSLREIAKKF